MANCRSPKPVLRVQVLLPPFFLLFLLFNKLFSGGLSSPNGAMYMYNLKIGQEYSLKQLLGYPFRVTYKGKYPVDLKITLEKPTTNFGEYEPIPDLSWVQLERSEFSLDPGETAETDVILKIPNDEKYLGKKYRVILSPATGAPKGDNRAWLAFAVGLVCTLDFTIAPKPPTEQEIREQQKRRLSGYLDVSVSPNRVFIYDIEPNKKYNLTKQFNEVIKIINATSKKVNVDIESVPPQSRGIFLLEDQQELPNPQLLYTKPKKTKLKPDSVKSFEIFLNSKDLQPNKKYLAVFKIHLFNERLDVNHYVKVYIEVR